MGMHSTGVVASSSFIPDNTMHIACTSMMAEQIAYDEGSKCLLS
jgi:hypothetical protein